SQSFAHDESPTERRPEKGGSIRVPSFSSTSALREMTTLLRLREVSPAARKAETLRKHGQFWKRERPRRAGSFDELARARKRIYFSTIVFTVPPLAEAWSTLARWAEICSGLPSMNRN